MSESTSTRSSRSPRGRGKQGKESESKSQSNDDGVLDRAGNMIDDAGNVIEHVQRVRGDWEGRLRQTAKEHPYLSLAGAAGTGFVLAGGLTLTLTRRLWLIGGRIAVSMALQQLTQGSSAKDS